jgi:tetratricopeptide (TPR) repeat protein
MCCPPPKNSSLFDRNVLWAGSVLKMTGLVSYCFPFVDSETKKTLESLARDAKNYNEFAIHLSERVLQENASPDLVYIAVRHAFSIARLDLVEKISQAYGNVDTIRPLTIPIRTWSEFALNRERVLSAVDEVLAREHPDWVIGEMLLLKLKLMVFREPEFSKLLNEVIEFLDQRAELDCYRSYLDHAAAIHAQWSGDGEVAVARYRAAIEGARKHNNRLHLSELLARSANLSKGPDAGAALDSLEQAYGMAAELGSPWLMMEPLNCTGLAATYAGEYDLAFDSYIKAFKMAESVGVSNITLALNIANACNHLGLWEEASNWAGMILDLPGHVLTPEALIYRARALIPLGRLDEASQHLDEADRLVLKRGSEGLRARSLYVRGMLEISEGQTQTGIQTMEIALDALRCTNQKVHLCQALMFLAQAHLGNLVEGQSLAQAERWVIELESLARQYNMPGVLVQAALLRAQLLLAQEGHSSARDMLESVLPLCESRGMRSLQQNVLDRLAEIRTLDRA